MMTMKYFTQFLAPAGLLAAVRSVTHHASRITHHGFACFVVVALLVSCTKKTPTTILAKIGNHAITAEDFDREVQWRLNNHRPLPDKQVLLDQMVSHELRLQKARSLGLDQDPDVRRRYESMLVTR